MKEEGTTHWLAPNVANNSSGFTALPAGWRISGGQSLNIGSLARWWTSTEISSTDAGTYDVDNSDPNLFRFPYNKNCGHSVRLIKGPALCTDVVIGTQTWTSCNLEVSRYRNGDIIPEVTDPAVWSNLTTGAWCYFNNNQSTGCVYGKLYNWYAVNDPRGLAPEGYHIPTNQEWTTLKNYLGGGSIAGGKIKEIGTTHWNYPNTDATNESNFTALGGSYRSNISGAFGTLKGTAGFWSATENSLNDAFYNYLIYVSSSLSESLFSKKYGLSIRLIKGELPPCEVTIGTQTWQCKNLNVATYRNGDVIPQVTDPALWENLTTGAWCYYDNDPANEAIYGKLYNWFAVNDPRGIAPTGYHVPSDTEWTTLETFLGGNPGAGGKLKEIGISHWIAPNTGATDQYGFTALPGGVRPELGDYGALTIAGYWWTATQKTTSNAWMRGMSFNNSNLYRDDFNKAVGYSVRLMKD
jgi:uncharacterized protein (TIGR02145 family)